MASSALCGYSFPALSGTAPLKTPRLIVGTDKKICSIDLTNLTETAFQVGFRAHSFLQDPKNPQRFWSMEKWGYHAVEVNTATSNIRAIRSPEHTEFAGHGFVSPKGDIFYATVADYTTGRGYLLGYDTDTYKIVLREAITAGTLHDCHIQPDATLLVASGGTKFMKDVPPALGPSLEMSSIVRVDTKTYKVINKHNLPDEGQGIGHFAVTQQGAIIALSAHNGKSSRKNGFAYFLAPNGGDFKRIALPDEVDARLDGEVLSVAVDEDNQVALITNPKSSTAIFINSVTGAYIKHLFGAGYSNVSFDPTTHKFLVGGKNLASVDLHEWSITPLQLSNVHRATMRGKFQGSLYNGSHSIIFPS